MIRRFAAVVIATVFAAGCGGSGSDETTSAADGTETGTGTTETTTTTTESSTDETTSGCPVGGSGECTMSIRCPEGDYDLEIGRLDATTAVVVAARPTVAPPETSTTTTGTTPTDSTPTASTPNAPPVLSVGAEVAAKLDRDESGEATIDTLCADGITPGVRTPGG